MSNPRKYTNKLYELAESSVLSWEVIGKACLYYMSEADVESMCIDYEWLEKDEDDDLLNEEYEEEDEEEGELDD